MGAPEKNQFWKLRSKHGRDKIWGSPEILWESALEYFEQTSKRKITKKDWVGKDAEEIYREMDVPFTIGGLCIFLEMTSRSWNNYKNDESYKDFFPIITRIEEIIYTQKFEGATAGVFNANIIAMELGLKTHTEITDNRKDISKIFEDIKGEDE